jgi:hypothetical protein
MAHRLGRRAHTRDTKPEPPWRGLFPTRDSVVAFSENVPGTTAKDIMDMVLVTQYFDTMKEIGASSKSSSVFIPHGPGAVKDVAAQIRDGLLQSNMH